MSAFFGAIVGVIVSVIVLVIAIVIWALNYSKDTTDKKRVGYVYYDDFADLESKLYKSNEDQLTFSDNILKEIEELKDRLSKLENTEEKGE